MLVTIHVSELQKQLGFINLIYFLHQALILCCWVYISKGLQPTGSVSCRDSQQTSWLRGCGSTMGSAACLLSRPFMSHREVVSTGMAVWFTSLTLQLQPVITVWCSPGVCVREASGRENKNVRARDKEDMTCGMCIQLCVSYMCMCLFVLKKLCPHVLYIFAIPSDTALNVTFLLLLLWPWVVVLRLFPASTYVSCGN